MSEGIKNLSVVDWLKERLDNCELIASSRDDDGRSGWMEDADYYRQAIDLQRQVAALTAAKEKAEASCAEMYIYIKGLYEQYMGEHACGDFTCDCGKPEYCGLCENRIDTEKLLNATNPGQSILDRLAKAEELAEASQAVLQNLKDINGRRDWQGMTEEVLTWFKEALAAFKATKEPHA